MEDRSSGSAEVGSRLARARERAGFTQRSALEALGRNPYNVSWISNKETGKRGINQDELRDFANLYRVSVDELVGVSEKQPQNVLSRLGDVLNALVAIPVFDMEAHASFGTGSILDYTYREHPRTAVGNRLAGVRVRGDCLVPDVMDGYFLIVDFERTAKPGDFIIITVGEETHVCRLEVRRGEPVAVNNEGVMKLDTVRIEGVVIQISRDV